MSEIRILLTPDKLEMLRGAEGIVLTYDSEDAYLADLWRMQSQECTPITAKSRKSRKPRVVIDTAKLGEIAELAHKNPRMTLRELSQLTNVSETALKQNSKIRKILNQQHGSAYRDAQERYQD